MLVSLQESLPKNLNYEIVIVDDGSTDETKEWLSNLDDPGIKVVINNVNRGYANAINSGVRCAKGTTLGFLNNDLTFNKCWIEPMLSVFSTEHLNVGIVGNIQFRSGSSEIDHAGITVSAAGQIEHIRTLPCGNGLYKDVFAVTGACILINKSLFLSVGGLDEQFINSGEDIDLCFKVKKLGFKIYLAIQSIIEHQVSLTRGNNSVFTEVNSRRLYSKWRSEIHSELSLIIKDMISNVEDGRKSLISLLSNSSALPLNEISDTHVLSDIFAENILARQEYRWSREIDQIDLNKSLPEHSQVVFSKKVAACADGLWRTIAEIHLGETASIKNFYVCGVCRSTNKNKERILKLEVGGLCYCSFPIYDGNFNVGIKEPCLIQNSRNVIRVFMHKQPLRIFLPFFKSSKIIITHFVIDDKIIEVKT
jgi:GT2 family glycosyltransferase